ncbi:c-type cytochrome [Poseidonocella sedimentorum]|uniref:Sulfur dehydrogenase subunit SoxD n=1 Tax=Poseidonocella sedimentorum TaxID=871652 RepID=A0A1I6DV70_9RHOB|nr:c-type cytochrome [Poseidonocella sedimentorum]SFR09394.1 sulfur dehydrogenase subunit SoxD [Poseidonocella sedimentorum]
MSKPLSQIFLPAFGGTALALSGAIALVNRDYGQDRIETLEAGLAAARNEARAAQTAAGDGTARIAELETLVAEAAAASRSAPIQAAAAPLPDGAFGLGREAHPEEIAAWDVDVLPDGRGLPPGAGDVETGEELFAESCASCHGDFAEGVGNWPVLAGGFDTLDREDPVKTVGSYWPYLSTAWDYIHRSMPFGEAGTLSADDTYAIVAYILYSNDLVDDDFELSDANFAQVEMHNSDGFIVDDRPETEYPAWRAEPCMQECKDEARITMRSVFLVGTPPEGGSESIPNPNRDVALPSFTADGPSFIPAAAPAEAPTAAAEAAAPAEVETADADAGDALVAAGEQVFRKCKACHQVGEGAVNRSGPHLNGLLGREMGSVDGFKYSDVFRAAQAEGRVWDEAALAEFLAKPRAYMPGTKMSFSGLRSEEDLAAISAYLASFGEGS